MKIYYCILKNYKGIFKKKHKGNTHLFMVPLSKNNYVFLGLLGQILEEEDEVYGCQLIVKLPKKLVRSILVGEESYFKERFTIIESLTCEAERVSKNTFKIFLDHPGKIIKSDLIIRYTPKYNIGTKKIFTIQGDLNLVSSDIINIQNMGMIANKQLAYMGNPKTRLLNLTKFKN